MSLRPPRNFSNTLGIETGESILEAELLAESAAALGHHGRKAEAALLALSEAGDETREALIDAAAQEVWAYFIQRELCGMRNHKVIIREMGIPQQVLNRMGAVGATKTSS